MSTESFAGIDTGAIDAHLADLYVVCGEIFIVREMLDEIGAGGRNTNDVYALKACADRLRALKHERAAIRRIIHESPQLRTDVLPPTKTQGPKAAEQGGV